MKIECILKRPGGTMVRLGSTAYHFKPDELDRHVAAVDDQDHQKAFLSITEGYRSLDPLPPRPVSLDEALAALRAQIPDADPAHLAQIITGGITPAVNPVAPRAAAQTPVEQEVSNADEAEAEPEAEDDEKGGEDEAEDDLEAMSDDDLRAEFETWLGRKPHHNMLRENMIAQIRTAQAGE